MGRPGSHRPGRLAAWSLTLALVGCATPPVVVDYAEYRTAPERYAEADAIVRTDLATLLSNADTLAGRRVELAGQVDYRGHFGYFYLLFFLTDVQRQTMRCYEREYRVDSWIWARTLARRADTDDGTLKVAGRYKPPQGLELDWIEYKGHHVDTDYHPPRLLLPWY